MNGECSSVSVADAVDVDDSAGSDGDGVVAAAAEDNDKDGGTDVDVISAGVWVGDDKVSSTIAHPSFKHVVVSTALDLPILPPSKS
jgi:hypothetical protein